MSYLETQIEEAREHLRENRLRECLGVIDGIIKQKELPDLRDKVDVLYSRLAKYQADNISGVISSEDVTLNQIRRSILEMLQFVERSDLVEKEEVMVQAQESKKAYRPLINDQFENNRRGWMVCKNNMTTVNIENHRLYMDIRNNEHAFRSLISQPLPEHQDILIKTKCKVLGCGPDSFVGICWGSSGKSVDTGFALVYYPDKNSFRFLDVYNGRTSRDSGSTPVENQHLEDPSVIQLELQRINSVTEIFLNKKKVYTCELPSFYGPQMGLVAGANVEVAFEYFQVGVRQTQ